MIIAVTGHRPDKLGNEYNMKGPISKKIYSRLDDLVAQLKPTKIITGMALGVDMIFANLAINRKIPLIAAIPFVGQEKKWPIESQRIYNRILSYAEQKVIVSPEGYASWKMQVRNEWMVNRCDILIAVWDGTEGGTYNCVNYAISKEKDIRRINPKEL
jgi:uncharacterized phage-like protein YoqJ